MKTAQPVIFTHICYDNDAVVSGIVRVGAVTAIFILLATGTGLTAFLTAPLTISEQASEKGLR
jgi:hypothetical protein